MAQDDYYYEIQLTNKQLVFYFMAGATGLILSFLVGVMVGKGVDATAEVQAARPVAEDRVVTEEPVALPSSPPAEELTYAQRLEGDRAEEHALESKSSPPSPSTPKASPPPARVASVASPPPRPAAEVSAQAAVPSRAPAERPSPKPSARPTPAASSGPLSFTIQVGAFKDRATAESVVGRLKTKGFAAYVVTPDEAAGLYNVRVGSYPARADAERVQDKLRDQEKFRPFIVRN